MRYAAFLRGINVGGNKTVSMAELRDARFVSDHFYFDALGVLRDMALMPPLSVSETLLGRGALGMGVAATRLARSLAGAIQGRRR